MIGYEKYCVCLKFVRNGKWEARIAHLAASQEDLQVHSIGLSEQKPTGQMAPWSIGK